MIDAGDIEKLKALRGAGVATYTRDGDKVSVAFFPEAPKQRALTAKEARELELDREASQDEFERKMALGAARGERVSPMRAVANEARAIKLAREAREAVRKENAGG